MGRSETSMSIIDHQQHVSTILSALTKTAGHGKAAMMTSQKWHGKRQPQIYPISVNPK
jgi:hypothetical protein